MARTPTTITLPVELDVVWRREGHEPLVVGTITAEIEVPIAFGSVLRATEPKSPATPRQVDDYDNFPHRSTD